MPEEGQSREHPKCYEYKKQVGYKKKQVLMIITYLKNYHVNYPFPHMFILVPSSLIPFKTRYNFFVVFFYIFFLKLQVFCQEK